MADSSKRGWRRGASAAGGAAGDRGAGSRGAGDGGRGWQSRRVSTAQSATTSHRAKLIALGLVVIALATYFALKVFFIPVKTPFAVISATQFAPPIPPNGYAREDAALLAGVNRENVQFPEPPSQNLTREAFLKYLAQILAGRGGGPAKNVLLLSLSTHGVVNGRGEPCLLFADSEPLDAETWLPFREISERVKETGKLQVVLFLDAGRIDSEWSLGILRNDFVSRLEQELTAAAIPNLHVLSATSNGQRSWTAPELGSTVFGRFLARGLQQGGRGKGDKITLSELVEHLSREVSGWVRTQRASTQVPRLLTTPRNDLAIAFRSSSPATLPSVSATEKQRLQTGWDRLGESWRLFEKRAQDRQWLRLEPLAYATIQRTLLRAESLLWAGDAYRSELEETQTKLRTLLETDPRSQLPPELTGYSLAWERMFSTADGDAVASSESAEQAVLQKWMESQGPPKPKEGEPPLPKLTRSSASRVAWRFARQTPVPSRAALREVLSLVDSAPADPVGSRVAEPGELLFLRMIERYADVGSNANEFSTTTRPMLEPALAIRQLAEEVAVPSDARIHYWVQPLVDRADRGRRVAEDRLFCDAGDPAAATTGGSPAILPNGLDVPTSAPLGEIYETAQRQGEQVATALALRDEIWSQLPFLSDWLLHADRPTRQTVLGGAEDIATACTRIRELAAANHALAALLDRQLTQGNVEVAAVNAAVESLRGDWQRLRDPFVAHCEELKVRSGEDRPTLRALAESLRVPSPLLAADERARLVLKYLNILFSASNDQDATGSTGKSGGVAAVDDDLGPAAWDDVDRHPVLDLLSRRQLTLLLKKRLSEERLSVTGSAGTPLKAADSPATATRSSAAESRFAEQGEVVRGQFADLAVTARELEDVTNRRLEEATETAANLRAGISEADCLARAAMPVAAGLVSGLSSDPAHRLRRVDLHLALLWHAARTLEDCWGPAPTSIVAGAASDSAANETSSYFSLVTAHYLELARKLDDTPKSLLHQGVDLTQRLAARRAAISAVRLVPQDVQTLGQDPAVPQQVQLNWPADLPVPGVAGLAAWNVPREGVVELLPVRDEEAKGWRRRPLAIAPSSALEVRQSLPLGELRSAAADLRLSASLLFRGHVWNRPFAVRRPAAVLTTTVDPRLPTNAKVKVTGAGSRRAFITFIFDCSRSMEQDGRMAKAKEGFRKVLDALPRDRRYEVGLRVYGRRAGYNRDGTLVFDQTGQPTDRDPNTDVELLVPTAPFTDDQHDEIQKRISELRPLGVTPLYLAIKTALESDDDFARARPEDLKHIIVLTDGINEQRNAATTAADVLQTIRAGNPAGEVRVDVVLFQEESLRRDADLQQRLATRATSLEQELTDIKGVAAATGGEFYSAENPDTLVEALRRALKLVKFSVAAQGASVPPTPLDLDSQWPVLNLSGKPTNYLVQLHGADRPASQRVTLEGGEAIELQYDKSEDLLAFALFNPGDAREPLDGLLDPTTKESYRVLPILPRKNVQRVEFPLAIQNRDRLKFTTRPRHVWAEIQPLTDAEEAVGAAYPFSDARFALETGVPVLQFTVTDWPPAATKAALRAWIKFDFPPLKPNGTAVIEELKTVVVEEDIPQATFQASIRQIGEGRGGWRLSVTERHDPGSPLFTARVQAIPPPDQLRHRYYVGVDTIEHEFDYLEKPAPMVVVTSRDRITENALVVPRVVMAVKD